MDKANRRLTAATCLLLAFKFNEVSGVGVCVGVDGVCCALLSSLLRVIDADTDQVVRTCDISA